MAKTFPTYTFHCPHCSTQLRVRERRFVNREIKCPACETELLVHLNKSHQIEVEVKTPRDQISLPVASTKKREIDPNYFYWGISLLLIAIMGYVYVVRPQFAGNEVVVNEEVETKVPQPKNEEPVDIEQPPGNEEPVNTEPLIVEARPPVLAPRPVWVRRNLPPTLAEKPEPEPIPIPEKWETLMQLEIARYEVPGLNRGKVLEELEMMAGTKFNYADEESKTRIESEPVLVQLTLEETSFAEILNKLLDPVGLTFQLTEDQIVIQLIETAEADHPELQ
ncbi:MAG: zinc ribbon domain-containing protein [Planctomycetaceae bacterium]